MRRFIDKLILADRGDLKSLRTAQICSDALFHKSSFFFFGESLALGSGTDWRVRFRIVAGDE